MTVLDILNVCIAKAEADTLKKPFRNNFTFTEALKKRKNQTTLFLKASFNQFKLVSCKKVNKKDGLMWYGHGPPLSAHRLIYVFSRMQEPSKTDISNLAAMLVHLKTKFCLQGSKLLQWTLQRSN